MILTISAFQTDIFKFPKTFEKLFYIIISSVVRQISQKHWARLVPSHFLILLFLFFISRAGRDLRSFFILAGRGGLLHSCPVELK